MGLPPVSWYPAIVGNGQGCGQVVTLRAMRKTLVRLLLIASLAGCGQPWNAPYPAAEVESNVLYAAFTDRPKHLDPAQSYTDDEITFTAADLRAAIAVSLPQTAL
jgi:predicted small lipoprotein YifL